MKKPLFINAVLLFGIVLFSAVVGTPLQIIFDSDVVYMQTLLPVAWDLLLQGLNFLFYWSAFAFLYFAFLEKSCKDVWKSLGIYFGAIFLRYPLSFGVSCLVIPPDSDYDFLSETLPEFLLEWGGDILLLGIAFVLMRFLLGKINKEYFRYGLLAIFPVLVKLTTRVLFDISYGAPTTVADTLWMIFYYTADLGCILLGAIVIKRFIRKLSSVQNQNTDELPL